jgi:hypothetical protein
MVGVAQCGFGTPFKKIFVPPPPPPPATEDLLKFFTLNRKDRLLSRVCEWVNLCNPDMELLIHKHLAATPVHVPDSDANNDPQDLAARERLISRRILEVPLWFSLTG